MMIESTFKPHCSNINIFELYVHLKFVFVNTFHNTNITVIHKTVIII
jgi:hypothetical protein